MPNNIKNAYDGYKFRSLAGEKTDFSGYWITSERFYHLPAVRQYGHDRRPEFCTEIQNIHTLFRKSFSIGDGRVSKARLFITGDDLYKLYLNGKFVGEGPAQSYPFAYNYNCYDVTDLITKGENTIAVHLYYQGLFNIYLVSADNLCGLICQLELTYEDGHCEKIVSDRSWRYTECDAYTPAYLYGYQTQHSENIDLSLIPQDWISAGFCDSGWSSAIVSARPYPPEYNLVPQITPTVRHERIYPEKTKKIPGGYLFDFGRELTGTLAFSIKGKKGEKIELRFAEELDGDGRARYEIRANCVYRDEITLTGADDFIDYFDYKGYRFAELIGVGEDFDVEGVYTLSRHYPFPEESAMLKSSDSMMEKVFEICKEGVKIGTQDTYYDCPTREKGGFVGDALITGLSHLILTADTRIYKKFISDVLNASRYCPAVMAHLPTYDINICADYSALVPLFFKEYYNYTGDLEFLKKSLPAAEGVWEYYSQFLNKDLLLENIQHMPKAPKSMGSILVDWPVNLRDGYDMEKAASGIPTVINMFFYGFLKTLAELYGIIGDKKRQDELVNLYTGMGESLIKHTYDYELGLFRDTADSEHVSLHANALQLFFGLPVPRGYKPLVDFIMQRRLNCGVYFAYFVICGLYNVGANDEAYDLLTSHDAHSFANMVKSGASTCMEVWGPDDKHNTSWCHPWSSSPIYFYTAKIMGITPIAPFMKKIKIAPKISDKLDFMELRIPTQNGFIYAAFKRTESGIDYNVKLPEGTEAVFEGEGINFITE